MAFNLQHIVFSERLEPVTHEAAEGTHFTVSAQGRFLVLYPGRLNKRVIATVRHRTRIDQPSTAPPDLPGGIDQPGSHPTGHPPGGQPTPLHSGVNVVTESIPVTLVIFTPDGAQFAKDEVTLADLRKYRDLRGTPVGQWQFTLSGRSKNYVLSDALNEAVYDPTGVIELSVHETVASESAAPLVSNAALDGSRQDFTFDLHRVGEFVATIGQSSPTDPWHGSMSLFDPDGTRVRGTAKKELRCNIALAALGKSRDAQGAPRPWRLQVSPQGGVVVGQPRVSATVFGSGRIGTAALLDRVNRLIGPNGSFIKLVGENKDGEARARMTITDPTAVETIQMFHMLDDLLEKAEEPKDLVVDEPFTLFKTRQSLDYGLELDVSSIELKSIGVAVGPGQGLGADVPAVRLDVKLDGKVKVKWNSIKLADAELRDGHAAIEVGIKLDADGTPRVVTWVSDDPFDIDLSAATVAALIVALGVGGAVTGEVIAEYIEHVVNDKIVEGARELFADPLLAPRMLMMIFGAHLTYRQIRFEGDAIVFEHLAPAEPDRKPRENHAEAIGRRVMIEGPGAVRFHPMTLGDTWAADNLTNKVKHIVVVMMENRSFDHVLGYRARPDINDGADGLTQAVVDKIQGEGEPKKHVVRPLSQAAFEENAVHKKTRIPKGVGHELDDVAQQLAGRIDGPDSRQINDPQGFTDNFSKRLKDPDPTGCVPDDVLGYYEADDLPMFAHLAMHYAYCDRYFCSHPGPTLPNRMYSLTGDVQYDRLGVPILRNNHGDNFVLSRAESIYDVLTKKGVSWRVYESTPSVTMLRMFARYTTNNTEIRPLDQLAADVAAGDLPAFTTIEPAMHHHPQDDDHPHADMWRGQLFIKRVYDTLRSNPQTWENTLLIITYDEHGGLYDHVVPPVADVITTGRPGEAIGGEVSGGHAPPPTGDTGGGVVHGFAGHIRAAAADLATLHVATADSDPPSPPPAASDVQIPYGVRVPTFVVSPWTMRGKGPSITLDHCSILKTVLARFAGADKPFLSERVRASHSFESFLTESQARDVPQSPTLDQLPITVRRTVPGVSEIITPPLSPKRMREGAVDYQDLSGFLARLIGR